MVLGDEIWATITWGKSDAVNTPSSTGDGMASYLFDATDGGDVVLTITDTTAYAPGITLSISGDANDDTNEGALIVSPGSIDHFVISHDNAVVAGSPELVTITAEDANNNKITNWYF